MNASAQAKPRSEMRLRIVRADGSVEDGPTIHSIATGMGRVQRAKLNVLMFIGLKLERALIKLRSMDK